jgi:hypothetical protein
MGENNGVRTLYSVVRTLSAFAAQQAAADCVDRALSQ